MKVVHNYRSDREIPDGGKYLCTLLVGGPVPFPWHFYEFSIGNNPSEKAPVVDEQQLKFEFVKKE